MPTIPARAARITAYLDHAKVGDPSRTAEQRRSSARRCRATDSNPINDREFVCTRTDEHLGQHVAEGRERIQHVWPQSPALVVPALAAR